MFSALNAIPVSHLQTTSYLLALVVEAHIAAYDQSPPRASYPRLRLRSSAALPNTEEVHPHDAVHLLAVCDRRSGSPTMALIVVVLVDVVCWYRPS